MEPKSEAQMDMMTMMMMQLPEFSNSPYEAVDGGFPNYLCGGTTTMPLAELIDNNTPPINLWSCNNSNTISFATSPEGAYSYGTPAATEKRNSMAAMREMIFRMAAMQPIHIDPESVKPPKRRNVKISKDPQSVAARHRRERISERIRILQRLVPGGTKMDTASMLDEAIHYVKFLKTQVQSLERASASGIGFPLPLSSSSTTTPNHFLPFPTNKSFHHASTAHYYGGDSS